MFFQIKRNESRMCPADLSIELFLITSFRFYQMVIEINSFNYIFLVLF